MSTTSKPGAIEWLSLTSLSVLWGGSFFFFKILVDAGLPTFTIVLARVGIAAIVLLAFVAMRGRRMPRTRSAWGAFAVMGALNNVIPFALIVFGESHLGGGLAAIFVATAPIFTMLLAHVVTRDERLRRSSRHDADSLSADVARVKRFVIRASRRRSACCWSPRPSAESAAFASASASWNSKRSCVASSRA